MMRGLVTEEIIVVNPNPKVNECIVVTIMMIIINHPQDIIIDLNNNP